MSKRTRIIVDIETSSACDLKIAGAWAYSEHVSTHVYCVVFAVRTRGGLQRVNWEPDQDLDWRIARLIESGALLVAHNAAFEHAIWTNILGPHYGFPDVALEQWRDTQAVGSAYNMPRSLDGLGKALGCKVTKDTEGAKLMKQMAKATPVKDAAENVVAYQYETDPAKLARLLEYCWIDVETTEEIDRALPDMHPLEFATWAADQRINRRGVFVDLGFTHRAATVAEGRHDTLKDEAFFWSGGELANTSSPAALKTYAKRQGLKLPKVARRNSKKELVRTETLDKATITKFLEDPTLDKNVRGVFEARVEAGKVASLSKLRRADHMVGSDGRLRNLLHYAGAITNRWTSSGVQLHNLPKCKLDPMMRAAVLEAIEHESLEYLQLFTDQPLAALSQVLRSLLAAAPGHELIAADYSAIEARVLAWLAGQDDVVELFASGEDVYVVQAARVGSDNRQLGKVLQLALGYGMGDVKFHGQAASYGVDLTLKQARDFKRLWREASPMIVAFWAALDGAARDVIADPESVERVGPITFSMGGSSLRMTLPSGRSIYYHRPHVRKTRKKFSFVNDDGEIETRETEVEEIRYYKPDKGKMALESTYGGKLAENATQAVARDLLADALVRLEARDDYPVVVHVHDSIAAEVPAGTGDVAEFEKLLEVMPDWAADLPIAAEGYRDVCFHG